MALMDYMSLNLYNTKSQIKVTQPTRALNTVYQNTTGRPIYVRVRVRDSAFPFNASLVIGITTTPTTVIDQVYITKASMYTSVGGFVPKSYYYKINGTNATLLTWTETQIGI